VIFTGAVWGAFTPGVILCLGRINNPLGVGGLPNVWKLTHTLMLTRIFFSAASLFMRLRRARGVERQQIKCFTYTGVVASCAALLTYTISEQMGALWVSVGSRVVEESAWQLRKAASLVMLLSLVISANYFALTAFSEARQKFVKNTAFE
jgi:hypothetical protein